VKNLTKLRQKWNINSMIKEIGLKENILDGW
jgi:hypothetical protein